MLHVPRLLRYSSLPAQHVISCQGSRGDDGAQTSSTLIEVQQLVPFLEQEV